MINGGKTHNREIVMINWKTIIGRLSDKAFVGDTIDPKHTSQTCPRCGERNSSGKEYVEKLWTRDEQTVDWSTEYLFEAQGPEAQSGNIRGAYEEYW